jgi:hypothetical protein
VRRVVGVVGELAGVFGELVYSFRR